MDDEKLASTIREVKWYLFMIAISNIICTWCGIFVVSCILFGVIG